MPIKQRCKPYQKTAPSTSPPAPGTVTLNSRDSHEFCRGSITMDNISWAAGTNDDH